jgi:hypothetical protein
MVVAICIFFITAGWIQHHLEVSRSIDPLTGRKIQHDPDGISRFVDPDTIQPQKKSTTAAGRKSLLSPDEDQALEVDIGTGVRYHVVFSTDCSPYQHWQSYLVFYTAMKVRQPGHVTRIASGCDPEEAQAMQKWFNDDVQFLSSRFHLQLTPKFSTLLDENGNPIGDYKFFNKPYGLKYWLENSELLQFDPTTKHFPDSVHNDVVILIDPDMALLRPITSDFSDPRETVIGKGRQKHKLADKVAAGQPFAQTYGFGAQWARLDLAKIAGADSPAITVSAEDGRLYYPAGPPYLATVIDMYNIALKWSEFVPKVYEQYPHLLAEMFAFSIAAAHLELPHQLVDSLMVSDVAAPGEGWELVDKIPAENVCGFCLHEQDHNKYALPSVLHMCQRYTLGEDWFFAKRRIPSDIYDCDTPLFEEPPDNLAVQFDYKKPPKGKRTQLSISEAKREAFAICYAYGVLNEAATFYKTNACPANQINLAKTRSLVSITKETSES